MIYKLYEGVPRDNLEEIKRDCKEIVEAKADIFKCLTTDAILLAGRLSKKNAAPVLHLAFLMSRHDELNMEGDDNLAAKEAAKNEEGEEEEGNTDDTLEDVDGLDEGE